MMLAGVMVFSQSGAVLAAENSAAGNTSVEIAAEEEPVQPQEDVELTQEEDEEPEEAVQEEVEETAQEETEQEEPADEETEPATEEAVEESEEDSGDEPEEEVESASEETGEESAEEPAEPVSEEGEEPLEEPVETAPEEEAESAEEETTEEIINEAKNAASDSSVNIRTDEEDEIIVYEDGEWNCPIDVEWLGDGTYDLEAVVMDYNGPESADTTGACSITDGPQLHVDGGILADAGITWVKIAVKLSAEGIDDILSNDVELDIREIYVERHFDVYDMDMLPGWNQFISRQYGSYVENSEHPHGTHDYTLDVTDITLEDVEGENVVRIENYDENGWNLRAENSGTSKVTLTYTDWDGTGGHTYEFYIYVGGDVYGVDVWTDSGSKRVLRGGTAAMTAQASHEQYDAQSGEYHTCTGDELAGITYEWSLYIYQDDAREELSDVITVTPDANDSSKAVVSFEDVPTDWHEGIDVDVHVFIRDGGEDVVAENNYWLRMDESYLELWPTQIDGNLDVGEEITLTPEVREYPADNADGYNILPADQVRFEAETYDDNAYEVTDNGNGTFTILRKIEYDTSFRIKAFVIDDDGEHNEVDSRAYRLNRLPYWISIRDEQGDGDLFNDGEWSCPIEVRGLDDVSYTLTAWVENHNGPDGADANSAVRVETEEKRLYVDGAHLSSMGISWISVKVSAEVGGYAIEDFSQRDFGIREARIDRDLDLDDRSLLPGWTHWIDRRRNCYVESSEYPDGQDFELTVTNVEVSDDYVVRIENSDENGWNLRAENMGECTVTVTYTDWDGSEQTGEFTLYVGSDVYDVDMWTEDGSFKVLPGGTVTMYAQARHEHYDPETGEQHNCSDEEMSGITYNWEAEVVDADNDADLNGCITVTPDAADPRKAVISFNNIPEDCYWANVKVIVAIEENGEEMARTDRWISMNRNYLELWPTELYGDLDVGGMIQFTPEVREYPADNEDGYNVLSSDQVRFETEIYDDNAYTLDSFADGSMLLRRLREYRSSFRIKAFVKNENGDWEYADDREYWLNEKNYDIWYDIDGNDDIYSDGERTFALDLSNLDDANYEIVPYVGNGEFGENGFEHSLAEGEGWSYNDSTGQITFYGDELYNMGIDWIDTKIVVMMGGIEVASEQRGFDVREARYDYHGAFENVTMLLSDGTWYMGKEGNVYVETSVFPDGAEGTYEITGLTFTSEEDEFDTREPILLESDEYNWKITPVRGGVAEMHATVELRVSDGTTHFLDDNVEMDFVVVVGGWRYDIWLNTSTGSDKLQTGGEITLFPEIHGEGYDWQTGEHYNIDTSGYGVRYEVNCTYVDQRIIDEQYDGDFEAAAARGGLWDYTENSEDRSIVLQAKDNAYNIDLEVSAFLIDPETGEDCAGTSRGIWVNPMLFELVLCEDDGTTQKDWNKELPPGGEFVFTPSITRDMAGDEEDPAIIGNPQDVTYTMEWYAGDGDGDPAHMQIQKANGEYVYPGDEVSAADAPFTVKRMVPWNDNINIQARWNDEEGHEQNAWRDLKFSEVSYSDGFIVSNGRGGDWGTWYYDNETVDIRPDRAKLDELEAQGYPVETTVEIGSYVDENGEMQPILNYNIDGEGHREEAIGEYDLSGIFDEQNGLQASGEPLINLQRILMYQDDEWGMGNPRAVLRIHSELNGVVLVDRIFKIAINTKYEELIGLDAIMGVGTEKVWENGDAVLYLEDSAHDNGINGYMTAGEYFDVKITDIIIGDGGDEYLSATNDEGTWKLKALKESPYFIYVGIDYTGGPYGTGCVERYIRVSGNVFGMEVRNAAGEKIDIDEPLGVLFDEHQSLIPYVTRTEYKEIDGEITETVTELPADGYTFVTSYEYYDERIISVSNNGEITPNRTGSSNVDVVVRIFDPDGEPREEFWQSITINVTALRPELVIPEGAVFYTVPGVDYTSAEIGAKINPAFIIYSMRNPDGAEYDITDFGLEPVAKDSGLSFTDGDEDRYTKMTVAGDAASGTYPVKLWARSNMGPVASGNFNVIIHPATIASSWSKATIKKTKYKDVIITYEEGDDIKTVKTGNSKIATAKKVGSPTKTEDGKITQKVRVTAGKTAGVYGKTKCTIQLKSGLSVGLPITVPKVNCTSITAKSSYTVTTLSTIDLGVKLNPVYSDNTITYTSANKKIATVTSKGIVKGVKVGKTTVTIKTNNNKTKKVTIVVKQGTTKLTTSKTAYTVVVGKTVNLGAKKTPTNSADAITYTSANKKIATVTSKGVVKGIKAGKTTITVKSGTKTKKVTVTVKPKTTAITTPKTSYTVAVKKTVSLGAQRVPSNSGEAITYSSSNTSIAKVSSAGVVTGVKKGKVTITIKSGAITKKVTVTVK